MGDTMSILSIKPYLEVLYYISSSILVVTVIIGILQVKLLKKDIKTRNNRLSIEKSVEYMDRFVTKIIPQYKDYEFKLNNNEIPKYTGNYDINFTYNNKSLNIDILKFDLKADNGGFSLANELELFSSVILSGLANENILYNPLGRTFCRAVESVYDIICFCRMDSQNELFMNTMQLYIKWINKLKS